MFDVSNLSDILVGSTNHFQIMFLLLPKKVYEKIEPKQISAEVITKSLNFAAVCFVIYERQY